MVVIVFIVFIGNENGNMFFWMDKHCNWLLVLIMCIFLRYVLFCLETCLDVCMCACDL